MNEIVLRQAYARLSSLKGNLPKRDTIEEKYVGQFHAILDDLERESGQSMEAFRIPASELRRRLSASNYITGEKWYGEKPECERDFLLMQVDAVLTFFTLGQKGATIGFSA